MYINNDFQNKTYFLKFLSIKNKKHPISKDVVHYTQTTKKKSFDKFIVVTDILKKKKSLEFTFVLLAVTSSAHYNEVLVGSFMLWKKEFNFYSGAISLNLVNYTNKNNFINLKITNMSFYLNLKKYFFIFLKDTKNVVLDNFPLTNVPEIFQEITEIKPDKSKKIFFKKKQVKTYINVNEFGKNHTYSNDDSTPADLLEKDIFIKNIFINTITDKYKETTTYNSSTILSNKSLGFWKRSKNATIKSNLVLYEYATTKSTTRCVYQLKNLITNNVSVEASPLSFNSFISFTDPVSTKTAKLEFYKNIFLYNFISLFSKISPIKFSQKYTYFNHVPEVKDFFFKKNNPLSRDLVVRSYKNKNKFNNFFPLYCLSFKKFKKLILFSKKQQSPAYSAYYMYYLVNFLESMCKKKIWIRVNTKKQITDEVYGKFTALFLKNKADQVNIGKHFFLIEFYEIIYLSFINRDINFFAMWFKKIMEKIHLKKHRKMVKVIHSTIRNNLLFLELTGVKGFSMDVRGKLGTAGNSKKKHYAFNVGSIAPTTKSHGLNLYQTTVRTSTGVLGITILMSY